MAERTKVFISYSQDSPEHAQRVLDLADALRHGGLEVVLDQYVHPAPDEGWPLWMETRLDEANFVLMVCTETYRRRVLGQEPPGKGLGVRWEGNLIRNRIYNDKPSGSRFIPVLFEGGDPTHIPNPVQGHTYYRISNLDLSDAGFEGLYRHLTDQASTPPPEIGAIQPLSPRPRWVPPDSRNRSRMLEKVRKIWITGFLERSLSHETRILLGLSERLDAVARPMDLLVQRPDQGERPLPPGTQIVKVFDAMEQLLILGAPGSGKTTLLLELARDLLDRAARDPAHPIPVIFPLSTWAESRRPLAEWLVEELYQRYDVPRKIGQAWVEADQILPLLDGLDEVKPAHRAACVEAINAFRKAHDLPLVICSRTADYQALSEPLQLYGAIVVRPLSPQQVDSFLTEIGAAGEAVRLAMDHDAMLTEMLDSPLMLNIVTVAYAGQPESQTRLSGTLKERRDHLFGAYVDRMFRRGGIVRHYTPQQTIHWLTCLARQMVRHSQTVFYIERMQPDWLPGGQRWVFRLLLRLTGGMVGGLSGGLVFGLTLLVGGLVVGKTGGLVFGGVGGGVVGLVVGVAVLLHWPPEDIICAETVRWSLPKVSSKIEPALGLAGGLVGGLVFGRLDRVLIGVLIGGLVNRLSVLVGGLVGGLVFGLAVLIDSVPPTRPPALGDMLVGVLVSGLAGGLVVGLVVRLHLLLRSGLSLGYIETRDIPNQGIHRSAWNAVVFGLVGGLVGGLVVGLVGGLVEAPSGWFFGGLFGLVVGLVVGLNAGGQACLAHLILRLFLVRNGSAPWDYAKFLDHAAERILLRKVGGGYIFIHRMLLEYFAARYDQSAVKATPNAELSQIAVEM